MLKSFVFSLLLHAGLIAILCAIPESTTKRFSQSGQTNVIAIQAIQASPSSTASVSIEPELQTLTSELDSLLDQMTRVELREPRTTKELARRVDDSEAPSLSFAVPLPDLRSDAPLKFKRREPIEQQPRLKMEDATPRPRARRVVPRPPAAPTIAIEQMVGLGKKTSVDLSKNKPPKYPTQAIRQRLEGVVLLEVTVNTKGAVQQVVLLQSSGHGILDQAAINAVKTWKGAPAERWGVAIESVERLPIRFRL